MQRGRPVVWDLFLAAPTAGAHNAGVPTDEMKAAPNFSPRTRRTTQRSAGFSTRTGRAAEAGEKVRRAIGGVADGVGEFWAGGREGSECCRKTFLHTSAGAGWRGKNLPAPFAARRMAAKDFGNAFWIRETNVQNFVHEFLTSRTV